MKIDDINIEIIKQLKQGRKSLKSIADTLSITENTVRTKKKKLTSEGILEISGLVDLSEIPGHRVVFIGIKLKEMDLVEKGELISRLKGVISVSVVTGRFDLMALVTLKQGFGLLEFYTEEMSKIDGISAVETFVIYKSYNLKVPYIL